MAKRAKQSELGMEGKGVAPVEDKKLDKLCDSYLDDRDSKASLAENMTATEAKILERMAELGVTVHRFGDQEARIKVGKSHIKIKTVKVEGVSEEDAPE